MTIQQWQTLLNTDASDADLREDVSTLPPEFADQIAEARFVDEAARRGLDDARFVDDGEFFNIVGFCGGPTVHDAPPEHALDHAFVDGLIGTHFDDSLRHALLEN